MGLEHLQAQTLQVTLSSAPKVNRSTSGGTATIFFDSNIEDLSIICTEENPNEPITKINDHQWFVTIDVKKDIEADSICYRNYLLKCAASAEYNLTTEEIAPNQVLYYTITLPNELEPQLLEEKARNIATKASELVDEGDSYLARLLSLEVLPPNMPHTIEAESALRKACQRDNAILRGHLGAVNSAVFSPDGNKIVSASSDGTIMIWDVKSGICIRKLTGHGSNVSSSAFSSDGNRIVSTSFDKTIRVWDANSGKCIQILNGHTEDVFSASFSRDGKRIVSISRGKSIRIWDIVTGKCVKVLNGHNERVMTALFSADGNKIVSSSIDNTVRIWNSNTGDCSLILKGHTGYVYSAAFSPNDKYIVSASHDKTMRIWDAISGDCLRVIQGQSGGVGYVFSAMFSSDGNYILSSSADNIIRVWDVQTGNCIRELAGHTAKIKTISFSPDDKKIVSSSYDNSIRIWDVSSGNYIDVKKKRFQGAPVSYSPDGKFVLSTDYAFGRVHLVDANTFNQLQTYKDNAPIYAPSFSPDGKLVVTANTRDRGIQIWDAVTGVCLHRIVNDLVPVHFSPNRKWILSSSHGLIQIWDVEMDTLYQELKGHSSLVTSALFSPDSRYVLSASYDYTIRIWDALSGNCLKTWPKQPEVVDRMKISANGNRVLTISLIRNCFRVLDFDTGECLFSLHGYKTAFFSPDSKCIICQSNDNSVKVLDSETGKCLQIWDEDSSVNSICISPDSRHILLASDDKIIRVWDFPSLQQLIDETRERFKDRQLTPEEKAKYGLE